MTEILENLKHTLDEAAKDKTGVHILPKECKQYADALRQDEMERRADREARDSKLMQWQPINTAPQDGTVNLLYPYRCADEGVAPTHWTPLPEPSE